MGLSVVLSGKFRLRCRLSDKVEVTMGSGIFDPVFIVAQIVAMQCFFYLSMGTLWGLSHIILDTPVSLDHFFTPAYINFVTIHGWIETFCTLLSGVAG